MVPPDPIDAFIGLGSNVGDRLAALRRAVHALAESTEVVAASSVYETEAHVMPGTGRQPDHLNAVVQIRTTLRPSELLGRVHAIERRAGRDPEAAAWSPRPLDLDVLLYGDQVLCTDELVVPHPRLAERRFVLRPLADLAPSRIVPGHGVTVLELLEQTSDTARIARTDDALLPTDSDRM